METLPEGCYQYSKDPLNCHKTESDIAVQVDYQNQNMDAEKKAFNVCIEMLQQRGCDITEQDPETLRIVATKPDGDPMCVIFNSTPKFDTKSMKEVITHINEVGVSHAIVIHTEGATPAAKSTLAQTCDIYLELFDQQDLQYNITKHRLQPTFSKLPPAESDAFKEKFGSKFGTLRHEKPISRFYDFSKGDVIRITRSDGYISYRIVR